MIRIVHCAMRIEDGRAVACMYHFQRHICSYGFINPCAVLDRICPVTAGEENLPRKEHGFG